MPDQDDWHFKLTRDGYEIIEPGGNIYACYEPRDVGPAHHVNAVRDLQQALLDNQELRAKLPK